MGERVCEKGGRLFEGGFWDWVMPSGPSEFETDGTCITDHSERFLAQQHYIWVGLGSGEEKLIFE